MSELSVREAAARLGISEQRTRQMLRDDELVGRQINGHVWLLDAQSVQDRARAGIGRGRPWSDQTVHAVVDALSDGARIDAKAALRLRTTETEQLARKIAQVFVVRRFASRHVERVRAHLALTGESALEKIAGQLVGSSQVLHGYLRGTSLEKLIDDAGLVETSGGNVVLHSLRSRRDEDVAWTHEGVSHARDALIAVDCARSPQTRVRSVGMRALEEMRERWLVSSM